VNPVRDTLLVLDQFFFFARFRWFFGRGLGPVGNGGPMRVEDGGEGVGEGERKGFDLLEKRKPKGQFV
jgi:hypothetical protein